LKASAVGVVSEGRLEKLAAKPDIGYTQTRRFKMERHEFLSSKIDWPNLVRHVVRDRVVVELAEGQIPVAKLVPIERPKTLADLDRALRQLPLLGDDAKCFEADVNEVRSSMKKLDDPWES